MIRKGLIFSTILTAVLYLKAGSVWASASLNLTPTSGSGNQFTIQILLNTGTDPTIESDVILNFPAQLLQATTVDYGVLYPENIHTIDNNTGKVSIFSYFSGTEAGDSFSGSGILATVQFTGKQAGAATVSFACTANATNDSNVVKQSPPNDILDCQQLANGVYTVTMTGVSETSSPTPKVKVSTPTPTRRLTPAMSPTPTSVLETDLTTTSTRTPTPTPVEQLLATGSLTTTLTVSMIGIMLLLSSLFLFIW